MLEMTIYISLSVYFYMVLQKCVFGTGFAPAAEWLSDAVGVSFLGSCSVRGLMLAEPPARSLICSQMQHYASAHSFHTVWSHINVSNLTAQSRINGSAAQDVKCAVFLNTATAEGTDTLHSVIHPPPPPLLSHTYMNTYTHIHTH